MQIGARDAKAAGGYRLVAVVFADRAHRQLDFVVAQLAFERTVGMIVGEVDYYVPCGGYFFFLNIDAEVLDADAASGRDNNGALHHVLKLAHIAGPCIALQNLKRRLVQLTPSAFERSANSA